ncbi:MAG: ATP synthase F1 subunit epsilon [Patescibacteria group bacterium]|jgi:F-type H+-transporting ATPase subunit epsilon|nr:ATP synthase F1 subunit epsilon [Patescibacteria group bacterium]
MQTKLVTLSGIQFNEPAKEVHLRTALGSMVVLPGHEPISAITEPGPVKIVNDNGEETIFASYGGLLEVTNNTVRILLDEVDHEADLIESEVQEALAAAQALKAKAKDQKELDEAQKLIDRQAVRLEVARIRRRPRN